MSEESQKIVISLVANSDGVVKAVDKSTEAIKDFKEESSKTSSSIKESADNISKSVENQGQTLNASVREEIASLDRLRESADKTASGVGSSLNDISESSQKTAKSMADISEFQKSIKNAFRISSLLNFGKKVTSEFLRMNDSLAKIGESASEIGVSAEYFQQLEKSARNAGVRMDDISSVFQKINESASAAMNGDAEKVTLFKKIGVDIEQLRSMNPQQVFEVCAQAMSLMGDSAYAQQTKVDLCGDSVIKLKDSLGELAKTSSSGLDGIFKQKDIDDAVKLKSSIDDFTQSMTAFVAATPVTWLFQKGADQLKEAAEEMKAMKFGGDQTEGGAYYEKGVWRKDENFGLNDVKRNQVVARDVEAIQNWRKEHWFQSKFIPSDRDVLNKLRDRNGLTPGQIAAGLKTSTKALYYQDENGNMVKSGALKSAIQEHEAQKETVEKQQEIIRQQAAAEVESDIASLRAELESPYQKRLRQNAEYIKSLREKNKDNKEYQALVTQKERMLAMELPESFAPKGYKTSSMSLQSWRDQLKAQLREQQKTTKAVKDSDKHAERRHQEDKKPLNDGRRHVMVIKSGHAGPILEKDDLNGLGHRSRRDTFTTGQSAVPRALAAMGITQTQWAMQEWLRKTGRRIYVVK